ncbi:hypothetical protein HDU87_001293 [Geranomyces variabilis]|uniref:Uncharacterized protein n=1 Tax=Geranomyces variabilis TaxID=109894 RepID=A0AAD5TMI3_9FUNG|nr:hypothetical protein HDU87_001293 [Geranomyces variabilis]
MPEPENVFRHLSSFEFPSGKAALAPDVANIFTPDELSPCSTLHRDSRGLDGSAAGWRMFADEELFEYAPRPTENASQPHRSTAGHVSPSPRMPHQHQTKASDLHSKPLEALEQPQPPPPVPAAVEFARFNTKATSSEASVASSKHARIPILTWAQERQFAAAVESGHLLTPEMEEPAEITGFLFEPWETAPPPYALLRRTSSVATN